MSTPYSVTLNLTVDDAKALHAHAVEVMTAGDSGVTVEEAHEILGGPDEPCVQTCLQMVFGPDVSPPGVSILDSTCE